MPHDFAGKELQVGDEVLLRAKVTAITATEDYCNVTIESLYGRKPDGAKETISAINAAVLKKGWDWIQVEPSEIAEKFGSKLS